MNRKILLKRKLWKLTLWFQNKLCPVCKGEGLIRISTPITTSKIMSEHIKGLLCPRCNRTETGNMN